VVPGPSVPLPDSDATTSDDQLALFDAKSGVEKRRLVLTVPPSQGLARSIASLPSGADASHFDTFDLRKAVRPTGRRVQALRVENGIAVASFWGGSITLFRISDGRLLGSYLRRLEGFKPGLTVVHSASMKAAVSTQPWSLKPNSSAPKGTTALVDLVSGTVTQLLDACSFPSGYAFSMDGSKLMVGDLLHACLHDVRTGKLLLKTSNLRAFAGEGDDAQDVFPTALPLGRWLLVTSCAFEVIDQWGSILLKGTGLNSSHDDETVGDSVHLITDANLLVSLRKEGISQRVISEAEQRSPEAVPELVGSKAALARIAVARAVDKLCRLGNVVVPEQMCRGQ